MPIFSFIFVSQHIILNQNLWARWKIADADKKILPGLMGESVIGLADMVKHGMRTASKAPHCSKRKFLYIFLDLLSTIFLFMALNLSTFGHKFCISFNLI